MGAVTCMLSGKGINTGDVVGIMFMKEINQRERLSNNYYTKAVENIYPLMPAIPINHSDYGLGKLLPEVDEEKLLGVLKKNYPELPYGENFEDLLRNMYKEDTGDILINYIDYNYYTEMLKYSLENTNTEFTHDWKNYANPESLEKYIEDRLNEQKQISENRIKLEELYEKENKTDDDVYNMMTLEMDKMEFSDQLGLKNLFWKQGMSIDNDSIFKTIYGGYRYGKDELSYMKNKIDDDLIKEYFSLISYVDYMCIPFTKTNFLGRGVSNMVSPLKDKEKILRESFKKDMISNPENAYDSLYNNKNYERFPSEIKEILENLNIEYDKDNTVFKKMSLELAELLVDYWE